MVKEMNNIQLGENLKNGEKDNKKRPSKLFAKLAIATILTTSIGVVGLNHDFAHAATITKYTVTASTLNVRKGSSTRYGVLGRVKKNQSLSVKRKLSNGWYQINFNGKTGYVSGSYVKKSIITNGKITTKSTTITTTKYTVNATVLNVRIGASTKYGVLGKIKKNQTLTGVKRLSNGWYQINFNGKTGYVSGDYVKATKVTVKTSDQPTTAKPTAPPTTTTPTTPPNSSTPTSPTTPKPTVPPAPKPTGPPTASKILNVPLVRQEPVLPSGCEANALAMALSYYGVNVKNTTLANQMPRDNSPLIRNADYSIRVWGDPEKGFVGNPYGLGITINPNPLKTVLDIYRKGGIALYGQDFSVIENYVAQGKPTLVWFTLNHQMPISRYWKTPQGKTIYAPHPLHCIVAIGYDSKYVYFNDGESTSVSGKNEKVSKSLFIQIYNAMGKRALVVN